MPSKSQAAFTLIELLLVLAIVAVILSISIASYRYLYQKSHRQQAQIELMQFAESLFDYHKTHGSYPTQSDWPTTDNYRYEVEISTDGDTFIVQAVPLNSQRNDGLLYLDSRGERRHYASDQRFGVYQNW